MVLLCLFVFWGGDVKRWGSLQYFSFRTTIVLAFAWYSGAQKEMQPEEPLLCMASMLSPDVIFGACEGDRSELGLGAASFFQ